MRLCWAASPTCCTAGSCPRPDRGGIGARARHAESPSPSPPRPRPRPGRGPGHGRRCAAGIVRRTRRRARAGEELRVRPTRVRVCDRVQEPPGDLGRGRGQHLAAGADLLQASCRHHGDPVGDPGDHSQVMGDEEQGYAGALLQLGQQVQDLRLHGDVEGARRLVQHQQARLEGEGAGDRDPLPLAAGALVRVPLADRRLEVHTLQELADPASDPCRPEGGAPMRVQRLGDHVTDAQARVHARVRVLEHHLHQQRALGGCLPTMAGQVPAVGEDASGVGIGEAHDDAGQRGLARAGLPDQGERLPREEVEVHVPQHGVLPAPLPVGLRDAAHAHDGRVLWCAGGALPVHADAPVCRRGVASSRERV
jgi:hypothetical protein